MFLILRKVMKSRMVITKEKEGCVTARSSKKPLKSLLPSVGVYTEPWLGLPNKKARREAQRGRDGRGDR